MTIDKQDIVAFGAALLDISPGASKIEDSYFYTTAMRSLRPIRLVGNIGLRDIQLKFEVTAGTELNAVTNLSNLAAALRVGSELDLGDGFQYHYVLSDLGEPTREAATIYTFSATCMGYRHGETVTTTFANSGSLTVEGNYDCPAIFKIQKTAGSIYTVNGMSYNGIDDSEPQIVIDGYNKTVIQDGVNVFGRMDMTEFPILSPGVNEITITGTGTLVVEYQPIYL